MDINTGCLACENISFSVFYISTALKLKVVGKGETGSPWSLHEHYLDFEIILFQGNPNPN
jgi:hypothetical protein